MQQANVVFQQTRVDPAGCTNAPGAEICVRNRLGDKLRKSAILDANSTELSGDNFGRDGEI
jgi:hypothetical protein